MPVPNPVAVVCGCASVDGAPNPVVVVGCAGCPTKPAWGSFRRWIVVDLPMALCLSKALSVLQSLKSVQNLSLSPRMQEQVSLAPSFQKGSGEHS